MTATKSQPQESRTYHNGSYTYEEISRGNFHPGDAPALVMELLKEIEALQTKVQSRDPTR